MDPLRNEQILVLLIQRKNLMDPQALQDSLEESKRRGIPLLHNLLDRKVLQENSLENLRKEAEELALIYESTMEIDIRQPPIKKNPAPPDLVAIFDTSHSDLETSIEGRTDGLPLDAPPKEFGNYELESEIGRGGMGIVFQGRDKKLGRSVAIKVMNPPPGLTKEERHNAFHRFEREASLTSQLTHPNIVPIFESGKQDGFHFITMAFIQGESLSSLMKQKRFSPTEAAELIEPICRALAHAHSQGVIHRDIKPSNILVDQSGTPYLVDFGLVRSISNLTDLTVTGIILGTPRYMSPEQAAGEKDELGPRSDLYSVGVVLYELVTGTPPFKAKSILELLSLIANYPCPDPKVKIPSLPEEMRTILLTAIAKDPADRYPGTRAMADDLKRFREGSPIETSPPPPPTTTTPIHPTRITKLPLVVGAVSLFVAIVFATLFFTSSHPKQPATVDPLQRLIFGVHPFTEEEAIKKGYGTLIEHLEKACDTDIELVICPNYEEVVARITKKNGGIHLALLSGYNYVQAHSREPELKPLARQIRGGKGFYHGVFITQQDSSIRTLEDLRGKRFAFVDPNSTSGYVFPRSLIRTQGKDPDDFFKEALFFRSHDKVLQAVRDGKQVDAGAVFEGAFEQAPEDLRTSLRRIDKLRTDPIPNAAIVASPKIPESVRQALRDALLGISAGDPVAKALKQVTHQVVTFQKVQDKDYDVVRRNLVQSASRASLLIQIILRDPIPRSHDIVKQISEAARKILGNGTRCLSTKTEVLSKPPQKTSNPLFTDSTDYILQIHLEPNDSSIRFRWKLWYRTPDRKTLFYPSPSEQNSITNTLSSKNNRLPEAELTRQIKQIFMRIRVHGFVSKDLDKDSVQINIGSSHGIKTGTKIVFLEDRYETVAGQPRRKEESIVKGWVSDVFSDHSTCHVEWTKPNDTKLYGKRVRTQP